MVFDTPEYRQSWWTMSEMLSLAYVIAGGNRRGSPKLKAYAAGSLREGTEYVLNLQPRHVARLSRLFSNTRPEGAGPECARLIRMERWGYRLGLGSALHALKRKGLQRMRESGSQPFAIFNEIANDERMLDPEAYRRHLR